MGSLRDELLKAKLISKKQAKKAKQKQHEIKRSLGVDQIEAERREREIQFQKQLREQAEKDRLLEKLRQKEKAEANILYRLRDIVLNAEIHKGEFGPRQFYFIARDKRIPSMEISGEAGRSLETGQAGIVETPGETPEKFRIITRNGVMKLQETGPEYILFFNQ